MSGPQLAYLRPSEDGVGELVVKVDGEPERVVPLSEGAMWNLHNDSGVYLATHYQRQRTGY